MVPVGADEAESQARFAFSMKKARNPTGNGVEII
jgi:hypothetical protein